MDGLDKTNRWLGAPLLKTRQQRVGNSCPQWSTHLGKVSAACRKKTTHFLVKEDKTANFQVKVFHRYVERKVEKNILTVLRCKFFMIELKGKWCAAILR